jgi:predicted aspartyl protease
MFAQPAEPTWTGGSGAPQASAPAVVLPFAPARGNLVAVRGAIGHVDTLQFLVDTGTSRTVIDARIARELHLRGDPDVLSAFGQTLSAERVVLPGMRLGSIRAKDPSVLAADLSATASLVGLPLDAIVGVDVLRGHCVVVDYRARQLDFTCTTRWRVTEPCSPDTLLPVVKAWIDGREHRLLVDTGADVLALFERAAAGHGDGQPLEEFGAVSLAGSMRLRRFTPDSVRIGRRRLRFPPVLVLPDSDDDPRFDGILPVSALARQVQIDLNRMAISW